jgi:hypothetical protein
LIQRASSSKEAMYFLLSSVRNIDDSLRQIVSSTVQSIHKEYENYISCNIPEEIQIHSSNDVDQKKGVKESRGLKTTEGSQNIECKELMKEP